MGKIREMKMCTDEAKAKKVYKCRVIPQAHF